MISMHFGLCVVMYFSMRAQCISTRARLWVFGLCFSWNCLCFYLESDRGGGFLGLLSANGLLFGFGCVTPPTFFWGVLSVCLGACFCTESDRRGAIFRFLFSIVVVFTVGCMTPLLCPACVWRCGSVPYGGVLVAFRAGGGSEWDHPEFFCSRPERKLIP